MIEANKPKRMPWRGCVGALMIGLLIGAAAAPAAPPPHVAVVEQASTPPDSPTPAAPPVECEIMLAPDQPEGAYATNLWPGGIVPYLFAANVSPADQQAMLTAMSDWEWVANVKFVPHTNQANYLAIQNSNSNSSCVGLGTSSGPFCSPGAPGPQVVNIFNWNYEFVVAHELGHALGLYHEQSRPDRDQYIQINFPNIQPGAANNFGINGAAYGPYNFDSIMHYDRCAFSTCCPPGFTCNCASACQSITVLPPNEALQSQIGQRDHMSAGDASVMSFLYGGPPSNHLEISLSVSPPGPYIPGQQVTVTAMVRALSAAANKVTSIRLDFSESSPGAVNVFSTAPVIGPGALPAGAPVSFPGPGQWEWGFSGVWVPGFSMPSGVAAVTLPVAPAPPMPFATFTATASSTPGASVQVSALGPQARCRRFPNTSINPFQWMNGDADTAHDLSANSVSLFTEFSVERVYVDADATGANNGSTWTDAFRHLQDALTAVAMSQIVEEVWIAEGTYRPDETTANPTGTGNRSATFQLISGVGIYGGFAGNETSLTQRQIDAETGLPVLESVLSGDLNANDLPNFVNYGDNSYHVVTGTGATTSALLDGFTVERGFANGGANDANGAGMLCVSGSPAVRACQFRLNLADNGVEGAGSAMLLESGGSPLIDQCVVQGNRCRAATVYNNGPTGTVYRACIIRDNQTTVGGAGGVLTLNSGATEVRVEGCKILDNTAAGSGGGLYCDNSTLLVMNTEFRGNCAASGGAITILNPASAVIVSGTTFEGNSATQDGGAANLSGAISPKFEHCRFVGNHSNAAAGAILCSGSAAPQFTGCVFSGNAAATWGGSVFCNVAGTAPTFTNCTFGDHLAGLGGGVFWLEATGGAPTATLRNCIIWNTMGSQISFDPQSPGATATVAYSTVLGGFAGIGNISADPRFVNPAGSDGVQGTLDDNLALSGGSPCIDAGRNADVPTAVTTDLLGAPRFFDDPYASDCPQFPAMPSMCGTAPIVDMGAYEARDCNSNQIDDATELGPETDLDGDGILDVCDLCPGIPNPAQVGPCTPAVWIDTGTGNWTDGVNWSGGAAPNNGAGGTPPFYCVTINPEPVVIVEGPTTPLTIESLTLGGSPGIDTLNIRSTLTVRQCTTIADAGRLLLAPGSEAATLTGGQVRVEAGGEIRTGNVLDTLRAILADLENSGTVRKTGGVNLTIGTPDTSFVNSVGGLLDLLSGGTVNVNAGAVTQQGLMQAIGNTTINMTEAALVNDGTITLTGAVLGVPHNLVNKAGATIEGFGGQIDGNIVNAGTISFENSLILNGDLTIQPGGTVTCDGNFSVTGSTMASAPSYAIQGGELALSPGNDTGMLAGETMTVVDGGAVNVDGFTMVDLTSGLTIGAGSVVQAHPQAPPGSVSAVLMADDVTLTCSGELNLSDSMMLHADGDLTLDGVNVANCPQDGGNVPPVLRIEVSGNADLAVAGSVNLLGTYEADFTSSQPLLVGGNFVNQGTFASLFEWPGGVTLNGTGGLQTLEAAGQDMGQIEAGFTQNFAMGAVTVAPGRQVTFRNTFDNAADECEALYIHSLTFGAGATVTIDNCRVYYDSLTANGVSAQLVGCGALLPIADGDANGDGEVDLGDWAAMRACLAGPVAPIATPACTEFDLQPDGHADLADVALFLALFGGP